MSKRKDRAQEQPVEQTPIATVVIEEKLPEERLRKSTIKYPVAFTWALCMNRIAAAQKAGEPVPSRKALVSAAVNEGVALLTARTQVQAFLKASKGGSERPAKLPRGLVIDGE